MKYLKFIVPLAIVVLMLMIALPAAANATDCGNPLCYTPQVEPYTLKVESNTTTEVMVFNPGTIKITADHEAYKFVTWEMWSPNQYKLLQTKWTNNTDDKVNPTGVGSICASWEQCSTEWVGGDQYSSGWYRMRVTNPTNFPLTFVFHITDESP